LAADSTSTAGDSGVGVTVGAGVDVGAGCVWLAEAVAVGVAVG